MSGWIGVDLDGTLAKYEGYKGPDYIGEPIPAMLCRVKQWLAEGKTVKIFTARVDGGRAAILLGNDEGWKFADVEGIKKPIREWCKRHIGVELEITNVKDYGMVELWDDLAIRVEKNTGRILSA